MKKREKKLKEYLEERKRVVDLRETEEKQRKRGKIKKKKKKGKKKNYAVNGLPELEALKKLFSSFKNKGRGKKGEAANGKLSVPFLGFLFPKKKNGNKEAKNKPASRNERILAFLNGGISFCIYASLLIVPLLIIPTTSNSLELPKEFVFSSLTGFALLFWLGKILLKNKIRIKRSFLFIPISVFLLVYFLSSIFSIYPNRSFWGHDGDESSSLIMLITCVLYFFIVTNHISSKRDIKKILFVTLLSGFLAAVYAVLQIWGIHLIEIDKLENRSVNTIGTFRASAVYFAGLAILASGLVVFSRRKISSLIYFIFILAYLAFLVSVFFKGILLVFVLASGLVFVLGMTYKRVGSQKGLLILPGLVFACGLAVLLLGRPLFNPGTVSKEILLSMEDSLEVTSESIKENPFLGSGPNTFDYRFELFRPNLGQLSSIAISGPANYFITLAATTGFLTLLAYLFLLFILSRFAVANALLIFLGENKKGDATIIAVSIFWLFLTIAGFIYLNNVLLIFLWWLALALMDISRPVSSVFSMGIGKKKEEGASLKVNFAKSSFVLSMVLVALSVSLIVLMYSSGKRYLANYHFQKALDKNYAEQNLKEIESEIKKAAKLDKKKDVYFRNASVLSLSIAQQRINEKGDKLSGEDSKLVSNYINEAIDFAEKSIEINPYDFENYRNIAWIYQEMGGVDTSFNEKALSYYRKSLEFSRNNPDLYYQMGNLYLKLHREKVELNLNAEEKIDSKAKEYLLFSEENLKKALDANKYHFGANLLLVAVYDLLGNKEAAFSKAKENWNMFFGNSQAGFSLATYYYRDGRCEQACPILETVLEDSQDYANAHYLLGICLTKLGKTEEALNHFEEVKLYNPNVEFLDKIISDLRKGKSDFILEIEGGTATGMELETGVETGLEPEPEEEPEPEAEEEPESETEGETGTETESEEESGTETEIEETESESAEETEESATEAEPATPE